MDPESLHPRRWQPSQEILSAALSPQWQRRPRSSQRQGPHPGGSCLALPQPYSSPKILFLVYRTRLLLHSKLRWGCRPQSGRCGRWGNPNRVRDSFRSEVTLSDSADDGIRGLLLSRGIKAKYHGVLSREVELIQIGYWSLRHEFLKFSSLSTPCPDQGLIQGLERGSPSAIDFLLNASKNGARA